MKARRTTLPLSMLGPAMFGLVLISPCIAQARPAPAGQASGSARPQTPRASKLQSERREEIRQKKIDNPEAEDGANVYRHSPMVHTLAHAFGLSVEATSRSFEIVNFVLLLALIVWGIARVLPGTLRGRAERIRGEIDLAKAATEDANRRLAQVEERLGRLDADIASMREQAEMETAQEEKRLRATLEQEKQAIVAAAARDIEAATKNAQSQMKKLAADLVIGRAKRQISVTSATDRSLIEGFLSGVPRGGRRGGVNG